MISLQHDAKMMLFTVSVLTMIILVSCQVVPALAQTTPASSNLVKRNYNFLNDQHLTARFGNNKVCGDHLCAPGEWIKLQENLNQAQITHPSNSTKSATVSTNPIVPPTPSVNSTSTQPATVPPTPPPIPTPPPVSYSVCTAVKVALGNSTTSDIVTKVMADLGCK